MRFQVARASEVSGPARPGGGGGGVGARHGEDAQQHAVAGRMDRATEAGALNTVVLLYPKPSCRALRVQNMGWTSSNALWLRH